MYLCVLQYCCRLILHFYFYHINTMPETPTGNFEKKIPINIETPESFNLKEINDSLSKL